MIKKNISYRIRKKAPIYESIESLLENGFKKREIAVVFLESLLSIKRSKYIKHLNLPNYNLRKRYETEIIKDIRSYFEQMILKYNEIKEAYDKESKNKTEFKKKINDILLSLQEKYNFKLSNNGLITEILYNKINKNNYSNKTNKIKNNPNNIDIRVYEEQFIEKVPYESESLESLIKTILHKQKDEKEDVFEIIGEAVINGSKKYYTGDFSENSKRKNQINKGRGYLYEEFHTICDELRKYLNND